MNNDPAGANTAPVRHGMFSRILKYAVLPALALGSLAYFYSNRQTTAFPQPAPVVQTMEQPAYVPQLPPANSGYQTQQLPAAPVEQPVPAAGTPAPQPPAPQPAPVALLYHVTQEEPVPASQTPKLADDLELKAILNANSYFDKDIKRYSGTFKGILDMGHTGINGYVNVFDQEQEFDGGVVDGKGERLWASLHHYFPSENKARFFAELGSGIENRDYTIDVDNGSSFDFGNRSTFVNLKVGFTEGNVDAEDYGVEAKHDFVLGQVTKHWGDATGDVDGSYDALRFSLRGRKMIDDSLSLEAGVSSLDEKVGDFLEQKNWYAQFGARRHFDNSYIQALLLHQRLHSELQGDASRDSRTGIELGAGYRLARDSGVTLDAQLNVGWLGSREDDDDWYVTLGATFWLGQKEK